MNNAQRMAEQIRIDSVRMVYQAGSGHIGGSLSMAELLGVLYTNVLRVRPHQPDWMDRDRFILSKCHATPGYYSALAQRGFFDRALLDGFRMHGSILQGHPNMNMTPGVDFSSGSLGQGLSVGCGMAEGLRRRHSPARVFVMMGDGEINEGQVWEAAMLSAKLHLNNLIGIIDQNGVQLDGTTNQIMPTEPLEEKWRAFGWHTLRIDGHDTQAILQAFRSFDAVDKPCMLLAQTVKGKGVDFMEGSYEWHCGVPNQQQYDSAMLQLEKRMQA